MAGMPSRKENRAASSRVKPWNKAPSRSNPSARPRGSGANLRQANDNRIAKAHVIDATHVPGGQFRNGKKAAHDEAGDADHRQAAQGLSHRLSRGASNRPAIDDGDDLRR